jgi:hypothetical protein
MGQVSIKVVEYDKVEKSFAIHYIADLRPANGATFGTCTESVASSYRILNRLLDYDEP